MPRDEPLAVVALSDSEQGLAEVLHRGEVLRPEELFCKAPDEAPGAAVALEFSHEGRATADSQEAQFGLEMIAHELAAMVVPQGQPGWGAPHEATERCAVRCIAICSTLGG